MLSVLPVGVAESKNRSHDLRSMSTRRISDFREVTHVPIWTAH